MDDVGVADGVDAAIADVGDEGVAEGLEGIAAGFDVGGNGDGFSERSEVNGDGFDEWACGLFCCCIVVVGEGLGNGEVGGDGFAQGGGL